MCSYNIYKSKNSDVSPYIFDTFIYHRVYCAIVSV